MQYSAVQYSAGRSTVRCRMLYSAVQDAVQQSDYCPCPACCAVTATSSPSTTTSWWSGTTRLVSTGSRYEDDLSGRFSLPLVGRLQSYQLSVLKLKLKYHLQSSLGKIHRVEEQTDFSFKNRSLGFSCTDFGLTARQSLQATPSRENKKIKVRENMKIWSQKSTRITCFVHRIRQSLWTLPCFFQFLVFF